MSQSRVVSHSQDFYSFNWYFTKFQKKVTMVELLKRNFFFSKPFFWKACVYCKASKDLVTYKDKSLKFDWGASDTSKWGSLPRAVIKLYENKIKTPLDPWCIGWINPLLSSLLFFKRVTIKSTNTLPIDQFPHASRRLGIIFWTVNKTQFVFLF